VANARGDICRLLLKQELEFSSERDGMFHTPGTKKIGSIREREKGV
jgi:hypothetical protein